MVPFRISLFFSLVLVQTTRGSATLNTSVSVISGVETDAETTTSSDHLPRMEWMARMFDHHAWKIEYLQNASHVCREHIAGYLHELKRDISWATKMNDASGRYNGQFFFGNEFWLGSSTLCWELGNVNTNPQVPPFPVHFSVAKVHLAISDHGIESSRQLMIGLCLPASCKPGDLKTLLREDGERAEAALGNSSIDVLDVRPVPGDYDILKDVKFQIVGGVAAAIAFLVVTATLFEVWLLSRRPIDSDGEVQDPTNNNNNELKNIAPSRNGINKTDKLKQSKGNIGKGIPSQILLCFSAMSNGRKILEVDRLPKDSIRCVHGLRFLSVSWVILVHTYLQVFSVAENKSLRVITERYFIYQTISNATFSVDSFFFISGLLVTILYFRTAKQKQTELSSDGACSAVTGSIRRFFLLVFYRVVRLTPAYLFVLGVHEVTLRYIHNTSVFEPNFYDHVTCDNYWWRNALYINTWYPQKEICMLWSWYMSNDTQFYIMAVIVLLIAVRGAGHLKVAASIVIAFLLTSWVTTFIIAYQYDYHARIEEPFALFDQLYDKPWMRVGPYLVGMATGWILFAVQSQAKIHRALVAAAWIGSAGIMLSLVYGVGKEGIALPWSAIYAAVGHSAWGLALAWITFACCTGHGRLVDGILSFRGFLPFSRLTYCAYLVHPMIMCITSFQMDGPIHLHNGFVLIIYFGNFVAAFLLSFLISLGFEAPVVRLLKIIMGGSGKGD